MFTECKGESMNGSEVLLLPVELEGVGKCCETWHREGFPSVQAGTRARLSWVFFVLLGFFWSVFYSHP